MATVIQSVADLIGDDRVSRMSQITSSTGLDDITIVAAKKSLHHTPRFHISADLTATVRSSDDIIQTPVVIDEVTRSSSGGITVGVASPYQRLSRSLLDPIEEIAISFVTRRGDLPNWVTATEQLILEAKPILDRTHAHTDDYRPDHLHCCIDALVEVAMSSVPMQWAARQFLDDLTNGEMR